MRVLRNRHIDASEPHQNGEDLSYFEYHYEYDLYEFVFETEALKARSYTDEPEEAHFLAVIRAGGSTQLSLDDIRGENFREACRYLEREGKTKLNWLGQRGYERVPKLPK